MNLDIANAGFLPTLHGEGAYLRSSTDRHGVPDFAANNGEDEYIARGVLSQPLYAGGALVAARRKASSDDHQEEVDALDEALRERAAT